MIGWMIFYILAIPAFSFFLPLYSFWRMDDFSWGQTRVVLGESGKKVIVHVCVALVRCSDIMTNLTFRTKENSILVLYPSSLGMIMLVICLYFFRERSNVSIQENELWDKESNHSIGSWVPPAKVKNDGYAESRTASLYGRETYYEPRSFSPAPSQRGVYPPPGYQSGRNTPQSPFYPMAETAPLQQQPSSSLPISDFDLERAVQDVLRTADLNSVTKREIRRQLESHFGMDLSTRKAVINATIDRTLLEQN